MVVKTYRGLLADGGQDRIRLQTIKGKVGYRIVKFEILGAAPGVSPMEHIVKIFKSAQTTIDAVVNFTDSDLLGVAYIQDENDTHLISSLDVIFDREIFNQDIFVTHVDTDGSLSCNYYIELEVIPLDDAGAQYTTLKDLRQT